MFLRADQLKGKTNIINPINNPSFDSLSNPNCIKFSFEKFSFNTQNIIFFDNDKIEYCIAPFPYEETICCITSQKITT